MRIVFAGTPAVAVPTLRRVADDTVLVVTRPPAPTGRKRVLTPSAVADAAGALELPVLPAASLGDAETAAIRAAEPDLGVIVAYGGLVRPPLLVVPTHGWINLHFSLLPRWRGAAPVQRAVIAGDETTGVSVFQLEAGLDTGPVFATRQVRIGAGEQAGHLQARLGELGAAVVGGVVDAIAAGTAVAVPQHGEVTVAAKLSVVDGRIDWRATSASVDARIRGCTPEPGAWTETGDGLRVKILDARPAHGIARLAAGEVGAGDPVLVGTGDGAIELVTVQPAGKAAMPAAEWLRGRQGAVEFA